MRNKLFLILIGLGILCAFIGITIVFVSKDYETVDLGWDMFEYGLWIGGLLGFIMLLLNGTFLKTKYFKITKGFFALLLVGVTLKILHWTSYANLIIIGGLLGIMISYLFSFLKKPIKKRLDYLKLTWVVIGYTLGILNFLHIIKHELTELSTYMLWLVIIDFAFTGLKNETIFQEKPAHKNT